MRNLDHDLRDALRRVEPPGGFAERVLRRVEEQARQQRSTSSASRTWGPPSGGPIRLKPDPTRGAGGSHVRGSHARGSFVRWLAAAAVVVAAAGAGVQYRTAHLERARAERAQGEAAGREVVLAMQIAGSKLQLVQTKIARMHQQPDRNE